MTERSGRVRGAGRRRRLLGAGAALVLATAMAWPTGAPARGPGHYVMAGRREIRFRLTGSHGYAIEVGETSRRRLEVRVSRGPVSARYAVGASRSQARDEIRGKLGHLGNFDVRFTPHGASRHLPRYRSCAGPGPTIQPGTVHGTVRFRAELGYTRVAAHRAAAELETLPSQRCHYGEIGHSKHPPRYTATFDADRETGRPRTYFEARRFAPGSRPPARRAFYEAVVFEQRGQIQIDRTARVATDTSTFRLPDFATSPENAVIQPPAPFTGSATFARTPESTFSWTGDLAVTFPGTAPLRLTGPSFSLHYCALRDCVDQESPKLEEESF